MRSEWNWEESAAFRLVDKGSWGWDADHIFYYDANSVRNYQYYYGCREYGLSCTTLAVTWHHVVDGDAGHGEATEIDILVGFMKNGSQYGVVDMYGNTWITVSRAKRSGEHGAFASLSKYWHREAACTNFTITFSDAPEADVACSWGYDDTTDLPGNADY